MVPLRQIMSTELVTVSPQLTLQEVARVFAETGITGVPVVSGRELVGVVSTTDLVEFETTNPGSPRQREERSEWGEIETLPALDGSEESEPGLPTNFGLDLICLVYRPSRPQASWRPPEAQTPAMVARRRPRQSSVRFRADAGLASGSFAGSRPHCNQALVQHKSGARGCADAPACYADRSGTGGARSDG